MAWNAPNDQKPQDHDPWTGQPKKSNPNSKPNQGPPLLEDIFKNLIHKLKTSPNGTNNEPAKISSHTWFLICLIIAILFWLCAGFHQISNNQQGLVFRFGVYQDSLTTGLHWRPWGIDHVAIFDRDKSINQTVATDIISQDANLAHIQIKLTYHVNDPKNYLFNFANPTKVIETIATSALQQTAASSNLDSILNAKNLQFTQRLQQNLVKATTEQQMGIQIDQVELTNIAVPESIKETFDKIDALYAEQATQKQQAADYEKQVLPPAQAKADQMIASAKAYAAQAKLKAQEEVADFLAILPVYEKAPALTRYRLYSQTMESILSKTTNVVMDEKTNGAAVYLPSNPASTTAAPAAATATDSTVAPTTASPATEANNSSYGSNSSYSDDSADSSAYANVKGGY